MAPVATTPFEAALMQLALPLLSSLQISALITWGLQGILCVQVYNYYLSFPKDPLYMKLLVYFSLALEIAQTLMVTHDTYEVFAAGYGDLLGLNNLHLLWLTLPTLGGVVGLLCHLTFAYRISLLSESKITGGVISALALCASISAFTFGGKLANAGVLSKTVVVKYIYLTCGIWNGSGALCDVFIAACMSYYLSKSHTGFRNTDLLITRIIRLTIETGVFTASILSAVLFVGFREKLTISVYFVIPAIMITKLYAITILATFNNRPLAVGGPPPLPDNDNAFEDNKPFSRNLDPFKGEIRIGRTVVQQVWKDDVPLAHLQMYGTSDDSGSATIKDDDESSPGRNAFESLTPKQDGPLKF
ncbi:hypothetical protein GALMADRAFT_756283 [Galerina marginata CBS 339.88]|uniref:DUF6534 domain-containing protein n=1 Tax=Galerina marginata (strain CBS 339.88) TaxID=685588 RepID=A0A067T0R2_GALM3|nr:hypothetical protein GALMADRAFT_756283 [Galerina marginata CBS 339.88]